MIDILLMALLFFLLVVDAKLSDETIEYGKNQSQFLKGVCAVIILFHHLAQQAGGGYKIFSQMGTSAVGVFFLASGYGLMHNYILTQKYLKKILKQSVPKLIKWCLFSAIVAIMFWTLAGEKVTISEVLLCFEGNRILNWFFTAIIVKYIYFALSCLLLKKQECVIASLFIGMIPYNIIARLLGLGSWWFVSSLCFPIGCYLAYMWNRGMIKAETVDRHKFKLCLVLLFAFVVTWQICDVTPSNIILRIAVFVSSYAEPIAFSLFFFVVSLYCKSRHGFFYYCGKHSAEMLFMQTVGINILRSKLIYVESNLIYIIGSLIIMIPLMLLFVPIYDYTASFPKKKIKI